VVTVARLSACLIVKNEAAVLERCLRSIEALVDEIIVVDTGSHDATARVARRCGARVHQFTWIDDFAAARNHAAKLATGDWILSIDADELVDAADHGRVRSTLALAAPDVLAFDLEQLTYTDERELLNWQPVSASLRPHAQGRQGFIAMTMQRLYRRHPQVRFEGRVHELVGPSVARAGGRVGKLDVPIHHYGRLDPSACRARMRYYVELGERKVEAEPTCPRAHLELGLQYAELGETQRSREVLERGLAMAPEHPGLLLALAGHLASRGEPQRAAKLALARLGQVPDCAASLAIIGTAALYAGELSTAIEHFERALARQPSLAVARRGLMGALAQAGRLPEALTQVERLLRDAGDSEIAALSLTRGKLLNVLDRPAEALTCLRRAQAGGIDDGELHRQLAVACIGVGDRAAALEHLARARANGDPSRRAG